MFPTLPAKIEELDDFLDLRLDEIVLKFLY
jgi:hypothetical protein